jgi:hypothetical protein
MRLPVLIAALIVTTSSSLVVSNLALADDLAAANRPPQPVDDVASATVGGVVTIDVLANDTDPEGDSLSLDSVAVPTAGTATIEGSAIRYVADATPGTATFTYTVSDGYRTADAAVNVQVAPAGNSAPIARDDSASAVSGAATRVDVTENDADADGDTLTVTVIAGPSQGTASVRGDQVVYRSVAGYVGADALRYQVDDSHGGTAQANVSITVGVDRRVTLQVPHRIVALHRGVVVVSVSPSAGQPSQVVVQHRVDGRWRTLGNGQLNAVFRLRVVWHPNRPGRLVLRAVASWGEQKVSSASEATRIVARFEPVVTRVTRKDVRYTWHPGCPVGPSSLRRMTMNYWDYHGRIRRGRLVGVASAVPDYLNVFRVALRTRFPIKKMYPADRYLGKDTRAMAAGDTSAFNCRHVTGNPYRISQHSYGNAIDINTYENPYGTSSRVYPAAAARRYFWRRAEHLHDPGVITRNSSIAKALWRQGWSWGARWSPADYQHWSRNGG